ncbi:hypothetical protein [Zavarzinella formosa]|nr:hypothetical protein [Zavarzinella formosa]
MERVGSLANTALAPGGDPMTDITLGNKTDSGYRGSLTPLFAAIK